MCWVCAECAEARGQPVEVDFLPLPCPFHPRAHSSSMAVNSFTFWAILQVPSQLAIPKEAFLKKLRVCPFWSPTRLESTAALLG